MTATRTVRTVLGDVAPAELGVTLTHEHLVLKWARWRLEAGLPWTPSDVPDEPRAYEPISLETVGWIRRYGSRLPENLGLHEEDVAIAEVRRFKAAGGGTIVEASNPDLGRDASAVARISRAAGVHVVMGCGRYVATSHPLDMDVRSEDDLANEIVQDLTVGSDGTQIRAGIIGEIGCSAPMTVNERKSLRAAVRAQRLTGAALLIHPGREPSSPLEIVDCVIAEGGSPRRVIMSHLDRTLFKLADMLDLARTGCFLEFDLFGKESFPYRPAYHIYLPNDAWRVDHLMELMQAGFGHQLLVAQDITGKTRLVTYGGEGYAHICENVVPIMRQKGMSQAEIDMILVDNPAEVLPLSP
jgi:phosphotriesterase-related protein